jgi:hypothetical protein
LLRISKEHWSMHCKIHFQRQNITAVYSIYDKLPIKGNQAWVGLPVLKRWTI